MATRRRILQEARKDAAAYYTEFGGASSRKALAWVKQAWADIRSDLKLSADEVVRFQPPYREALAEETERLALPAKAGPEPPLSPIARKSGKQMTTVQATARFAEIYRAGDSGPSVKPAADEHLWKAVRHAEARNWNKADYHFQTAYRALGAGPPATMAADWSKGKHSIQVEAERQHLG